MASFQVHTTLRFFCQLQQEHNKLYAITNKFTAFFLPCGIHLEDLQIGSTSWHSHHTVCYISYYISGSRYLFHIQWELDCQNIHTSLCPHSRQHLLFVIFLMIAILKCEVIALWFRFASLSWLMMAIIFLCACQPFMCLWKMSNFYLLFHVCSAKNQSHAKRTWPELSH